MSTSRDVLGRTVVAATDTDRVRLAGYWGPRGETADSASNRVYAFLTKLQEIDPYFSQWYRKGESKKQAQQHRVELTPAQLKEVVLTGVTLRKDRTVDEGLGFVFGLWDGRDDGCSLRVTCGINSSLAPNVLLFYFPEEPTVASRLLRKDTAARIMQAAVYAWEPDWANIASEAYLKTVPDLPRPSKSPLPGWLLYLSLRRGVLPPLSPPAEVVPVDSLGSIIVTVPDLPRDSANGTATQIAQAMESLGSAGVLGPIIR